MLIPRHLDIWMPEIAKIRIPNIQTRGYARESLGGCSDYYVCTRAHASMCTCGHMDSRAWTWVDSMNAWTDVSWLDSTWA